jgi:hypothetical protein
MQPYQVVESHPDFEIRRYPQSTLIEVETDGDFTTSTWQGFRPLAAFIFGGNSEKREIAMTAPVLQFEQPKNYKISFVLPEGMTQADLPRPLDARITSRDWPEHLAAARKFGGQWTEAKFRSETKTLLNSLKNSGFTPSSEPYWARFDGPWKPWFLKHNEVQVEIQE